MVFVGKSVHCLYAIIALTLSPSLSLAAPASITRAAGVVQVRYGSFIDRGTRDPRQRAPAPAGAVPWVTLSILPSPLAAGDEVRTGAGAAIVVELEDGSLLDLGADASLAVEDLSKGRGALRLSLGTLRAQVRKDPTRRFEVRTPTALCSVRGTDFTVTVGAAGRTEVKLRSGLLGVEDNRGRQMLLRPGESLRVDLRGMANPERSPEPEQARRGDFRSMMRRELGLDSSREEAFIAAARETRLAEHQQGKALMDLSGRRVRVEEYILRPRSDQFRLVALNSREGRLDSYSFLGTFNKTLPTDLSLALGRLGGDLDAAPDLYLTGYETRRSNGSDSLVERAEGGHPVDLNSNADLSDDESSFFDAPSDRFVDSSARSVYWTLFDRYGFYLNGKLKHGWTGSGLQSYSDAVGSSVADPITGAALSAADAWLDGSGALATRSVSLTAPDPGSARQRVSESYSDGSFLVWEHSAVGLEGDIVPASRFGGRFSGPGFQQGLLGYGLETTVTATEFGGRKLDLLVDPKFFIQTGALR